MSRACMTRLRRGILALALVCAFPLVSWAQDTTMSGTVTDSTGAVMVGANVTVTNPATSFTSKTLTSATGTYYVPYLAPGTYRLTVEQTGFKRTVSDGILISAGEVPRIDVKLEIGQLAESVTVTGASPLLETETSSSGQILSGDQLVKMPINEKRVTQMLYYYEGTNSMSGFHILGQRQNMIGFTLDGIEAKEPGTPGDPETAAWEARMRREADDLKLESFGVELLHAIGTVYVTKASAFLKSKKFLGM